MHADLKAGKFPELSENNTTLMYKYLTRDVWAELKDHKTVSTGWTLAKAINPGCINQHDRVGVWAGDIESYKDFERIFLPIIKEYHGVSKHTISDLEPAKVTGEIKHSELIESTRIRLARNLHGFPLSPISKDHLLKIEELMKTVFERLEGDFAGTYYTVETVPRPEFELMLKNHYIFDRGDPVQAAAGCYDYWPTGRGIFINHHRTFLVWVNEEDHLRIISMQKGSDVISAFDRLAKGVKVIEDEIKNIKGNEQAFLCDENLGMITRCPTNLGTGLRCSVLMNLHNLHKLEGAKELNKLAQHSGCHVHASRDLGDKDICYVSNRYCLGRPAHELVQNLIDTVNKLAKMELNASG